MDNSPDVNEVIKPLEAAGTFIGNSKISLPALKASTSNLPGEAYSLTPFIFNASVIIKPLKFHWFFNTSVITFLDKLVGLPLGSKEGIFK